MGAQFGVVLVVENGVQIEVATFRADDAYVDGRHPSSVRFTTAEEDAERRDFTINGMFFDPLSEHVLDFVGGQEDLARRIVRAIGDPRKRFSEDKLRMIRGIRFASRLDFTLDPGTAEAIREMVPERIARINGLVDVTLQCRTQRSTPPRHKVPDRTRYSGRRPYTTRMKRQASFFGSPILAAAAMSFSSVSVVGNALRLRTAPL